MKEVMLMIGTRKGGFLAFSESSRKRWTLKGPFVKGTEVHHMTFSQNGTPTMYLASNSSWWGPHLQVSYDFGETWEERSLGFEQDRSKSVKRIWMIKSDNSGRLYAGVDPATMFCSDDGGSTWEEFDALTDHSTREHWQPGAGVMMVHSVCLDSNDASMMFVGISAAGVFRTDDAGKSWEPRNKGVRTDFLPDKFPEVGQCTHHLEMHPSNPEILYQQNHCGVYRSEDAGESWIDISDGLPSRFGFPIAVNPHDGDWIYVVPEESDQCRFTPDGKFGIYRSKNRGDTWEALTNGLPQSNAYLNVLRAAMAVDDLDPPGVYVGTQGGQVVASTDAGDHWALALNWLPPIYSIQSTVVER